MKQREMILFAAVCRTGSVTAGAAAAGMTQPAASTMLKQIEERMGARLFSREKRRLELTADGRALLPEVTHALAALESVRHMAESLGRSKAPRLVVGAVSAVSASVLPRVLYDIRQEAPDTPIAVRAGTALEVVEMALQERIDIGVILGSSALQHVGFRQIGRLGLVCAMPPDHPYAAHEEISLPQLIATPYVAHSRHLPVGALTATALERAGLPFAPALEVMQFSAACALAQAGCGIAILDSLTGRYAQGLGLAIRPLRQVDELSLGLVWPLTKGMSRLASRVAAGVADIVRGPAQGEPPDRA